MEMEYLNTSENMEIERVDHVLKPDQVENRLCPKHQIGDRIKMVGPCLCWTGLVALRSETRSNNPVEEVTKDNHANDWVRVTKKKRGSNTNAGYHMNGRPGSTFNKGYHAHGKMKDRKDASDFERVMKTKRFINTCDIEAFERRLKGIMIGDVRIDIDHAKFIRGEDKGVLPSHFPPVNPTAPPKPFGSFVDINNA
uniref:Uncharacterized protein n=1 Tax=Tanacetum cinerariifolium TaxID=118510 RepID=A0A699GMZ3_TANCI|nr:hypothetical protein [Tanacetum cinerariifolium]